MARLTSNLIPLFLVAIAASLALAVQRAFAADTVSTLAFGIATLFALMSLNGSLQRARERRLLDLRLRDLGSLESTVDHTVRALGGRVAALEQTAAADRGKLDPILAEVELLSRLVGQLAETLAGVEERLASAAAAPMAAAPVPAPALQREPAAPSGRDVPRLVSEVRAAVDAERIELALQPIVTLPHRKPRYYEVFARLRTATGDTLMPAEFIPAVTGEGLMPRLDRMMMARAVEALSRLSARQRDLALFVNLSGESLNDGTFFARLLELVRPERRGTTARPEIAQGIILEMTQAALQSFGPVELESLSALADLGFRFSVDRVGDLRADFAALGQRGFRYTKVPADLLLARPGRHSGDIAPADLADMLARHAIELIADRIETEPQVIDLLDFNVRLGQGNLFSPPRPVRVDLAPQATARAAPLAVAG